MRILLVEDDRSISSAVMKRLAAECHAADLCQTGPDAWDYISSTDYDVIIMDIMLPGEDGLSLVRRMRALGKTTPVLFLTARDAVRDRVTGLDAGGDDYMVKPFEPDELMARIRVLGRRSMTSPAATNVITAGPLTIDMTTRRVRRDGREIELTGREYSLLEYMARNRDIVLSRRQIEEKLFSYDYIGASNIVDVYIRYLRKKVDEGFEKKLIHTVRGAGYVLREDA